MGKAKKATTSGKSATTKVKKAPAKAPAAKAAKAPAAKAPAAKAAKAPATKGAKKPAGKAAKGGKEAKADSKQERKLGLRGAAPWAARHAAKHAAEARARAALPPPPGSARLTIRVPQAAEDIKAKVLHLHNTLAKIKGLRKNLNKSFFEVGQMLAEIREKKSYEAKGFGTFETFLEREMSEVGKVTCLRLVKVVGLFQREAALEIGMDKLFLAITAIEMEALPDARVSGKLPAPPSTSALPLRPPGR